MGAARGRPTVAVIGGGLAGLAAALRLAERGHAVTVYEQLPYLGGNFGAHSHAHADGETTYHEHSYHMLLPWYENFWGLAEDLGLRRDEHFEPRTAFRHLRAGAFPETVALRPPGTLDGLAANLVCGLRPIPDMFLYAYSLLDLLTQRFEPGRLLDAYTVAGFMQSRPYASEASASLHEHTLINAFASPSYLTSARSYQRFIAYGFRRPEPMMWVLRGDGARAFFAPLRARLEALGVRIRLSRRVRRLEVEEGRARGGAGRITAVVHEDCADDPSVMDCVTVRTRRRAPPAALDVDRPTETDRPDYVVLAVPPGRVAPLLIDPAADAPDAARADTEDWLALARIPRLRGAPMASLDLHFTRRLDGIPKEHVVLLDSMFRLSFIDNGQAWPGQTTTVLNVVASAFEEPAHLNPGEVARLIVREVARYVPFGPGDVAWDKCHFQPNVGETLFLNEVGTERWRPAAVVRGFPNLFLAGDYCRTVIDVVTVEGAVVSGLEAARALHARAVEDGRRAADAPPIAIRTPPTWDPAALRLLKALLAPAAAGAAVWSWADDQARALQQGRAPARVRPDLVTLGTTLALAPWILAADAWRAAWSLTTRR
jgi:phytoene dehydrogenase-like protein